MINPNYPLRKPLFSLILRLMTYRDEFDEPPRGKSSFLSRVGPKAAFFVVLIALSFMIGVVWKLYVGASNNDGQNVPIVRADDNPFKVIPDDPGGMEIPHKDSTIFSSLKDAREGDNKIENLLAEDDNEEPMPRSQLFAGLNTEKNPDLDNNGQASPLDKPVGDIAQNIGQEMEKTPEVAKEVVQDTVKDVVKITPKLEIPEAVVPEKVDPVVKPVEAPKPDPVIVKKAALKAQPQPVKTIAAPSVSSSRAGGYYIQLASVKSAQGAESEWKKILKKYSSQLSGYSHRVERADLGAKGVFYRIQAGPVSKDKATATCARIKKVTPGGCLVKKK